MEEKFLKITDVVQMLNISRATIYNKLKENKFPKPIKITKDNRWKLSELNNWLKSFT